MYTGVTATLSALLLALFSLAVQAEPSVIRLATTTSTYNSGLLGELLPVFEQQHDARVHVIAVGTGKALRMGQAGDVDLVMTHAPEAEARFIAAGYGVEPRGLMYNDFVLVGPAGDPAAIRGEHDLVAALRRIAASDAGFISRGDDSGTHKKELALWADSGVAPAFANYKEVGQGMGKVLQIADELNAYTLVDRGTWLAYADRLRLQLAVEGDRRLFNPYQVILVNPALHPGLNSAGARLLQQWLLSADGQARINGFRIKGEALFHAATHSLTVSE